MFRLDFQVDNSGKIPAKAKEGFVEIFRHFSGKRIEVKIDRLKKKRSPMQNAYYWAVIVPIFAGYMGYSKSEYEIVHGILKEMFLRTIETKNGVEYARVKSTSELSTMEFVEFIQDLQRFGAEQGLNIPDPNEETINE